MDLNEIASTVTSHFRIEDDILRQSPDHSTLPGQFIRPLVIEATIETTTHRASVLLKGHRLDPNTGLITPELGYTSYRLTDHDDVHNLGSDLATAAIEIMVEKYIVKAEA